MLPPSSSVSNSSSSSSNSSSSSSSSTTTSSTTMHAATIQTKILYIGIYVFIWGVHSILIKQSKGSDGKYPYDIWIMVLVTEFAKLMLSIVYLFVSPPESLQKEGVVKGLYKKLPLAKFFAIPAAIYLFANILSFVNINLLSVPTYRVLINTRVIFSGLLFQQFFNKHLTRDQWFALLLLILGCTTEQLGSFSLADGGLFALGTMLIQAFCSSLGGVYFQWLLQRDDGAAANKQVTLVEKNICLYSWGVLFNLTYILISQSNTLSVQKFMLNYDASLYLIVLFGAFGGFTTSLLLRYLDVVAKEYANALEMLFVATLSWYLFSTTISAYLLSGMVLVAASVALYNREDSKR